MTTTTLAHALSASDQSITLTASEDLVSGQLLAFDAEYARVLVALTPTQALVQRGVNGTPASAHAAGVTVSIDVPEGFLTGPQVLPAFGIDTNVLTGLGPSDAATFQPGGGGGGTPALPFTSVQFNNSGAFGGSEDFTWDGTHAFVGSDQLITFTDLASPPSGTALGSVALPFSYLNIGFGGDISTADVYIGSDPSLFTPSIASIFLSGQQFNVAYFGLADSNRYASLQIVMETTDNGSAANQIASFTQSNSGTPVGYQAIAGSTATSGTLALAVGFKAYSVAYTEGALTRFVGFLSSVSVPYAGPIAENIGFMALDGTLDSVVGFRSDITAGAGKYAFYGAGTAASVFGGTVTATDFIVSGSRFMTDTTSGHTAALAAWNGSARVDVATWTNAATPTFDLMATTTIGNAQIVTPSSSTSFTNKSGSINQWTGNLPTTQLNSGIGATSSTFWRGDGTWATAGAGTVTSVAASVPTFLSIAGSPITSSGTLAISYSGTALPVANGGTAATSASITAFNNITGLSAAGTTGTTSTNLVFSTSPTFVTPVLGAATATSVLGSGGAGLDSAGRLLTNNLRALSTAFIRGAADGVILAWGDGGFDFVNQRVAVGSDISFGWGSTTSTLTLDAFFRRGGAAATIQMGADVNGAAVAQTLQAANGITGTDKAGADITIGSGKGTGAAAVSAIRLSTPTVLGSGTTAQSRVDRLVLNSTTLTFSDALDIVFNATTGTKIGTATTQKLAFYNATPIVQGASVADATGGAIIDAEARTAINALISRIEATGLIATV